MQWSGPNFIELLSTKVCLAWHFFLDKNRITNQFSVCCILLFTGIQLLFANPENHVEIWLVILFLSRKKFPAEQIFVLTSSMKLGPVDNLVHTLSLLTFHLLVNISDDTLSTRSMNVTIENKINHAVDTHQFYEQFTPVNKRQLQESNDFVHERDPL